MKDNFSTQADLYARYRPNYPDKLISDIVKLSPAYNLAWDCGTGNGQMANLLAPHFEQVIATDISEQQLEHAQGARNITYKKEPAEATSHKTNSVDLITVAQAVHWFDFEKFYTEVNRVLRNNGILSLLGYGLFKTNSELDKPVSKFCYEVIGPYWDEERKYIDEEYANLPFPFKEIQMVNYEMIYEWSLEEMIGYFQTWSAVQHYIAAKQENPVEWIESELKKLWPESAKVEVSMDVLLRVGRKE
ncbi:MAG: class I SAM-dependent methyltransferase [Balneolaceae bacterium]